MGTEILERLVSLPRPVLKEAPSSWLTRAAFSQDEKVGSFRKALGIDGGSDLDLAVVRWLVRSDAKAENEWLRNLLPARRVLLSLMSIDSRGSTYLLKSNRGGASFRFCPECLTEMPEHAYLVEWRFRCWRHCPEHQIPLHSACPVCGASVKLPLEFREGKDDEVDIVSLAQCGACGCQLARAAKLVSSAERPPEFIVQNGRALVAALECGYFYLPHSPRRQPLHRLSVVLRSGLVANGTR